LFNYGPEDIKKMSKKQVDEFVTHFEYLTWRAETLAQGIEDAQKLGCTDDPISLRGFLNSFDKEESQYLRACVQNGQLDFVIDILSMRFRAGLRDPQPFVSWYLKNYSKK
jgi:hypothetical protein